MTTLFYIVLICVGSYIIVWQVKYSRNLKPIRYADHYNSPAVLDAAEVPPLSIEECQAYEMLSKASANTIWGAAIQFVIQEQSVKRFRELICQLKSQAADEPATMEKIIGTEALNKIMSL